MKREMERGGEWIKTFEIKCNVNISAGRYGPRKEMKIIEMNTGVEWQRRTQIAEFRNNNKNQ